jgi:hypothetical protein
VSVFDGGQGASVLIDAEALGVLDLGDVAISSDEDAEYDGSVEVLGVSIGIC